MCDVDIMYRKAKRQRWRWEEHALVHALSKSALSTGIGEDMGKVAQRRQDVIDTDSAGPHLHHWKRLPHHAGYWTHHVLRQSADVLTRAHDRLLYPY